jgi:dCMP deaminase
MEICPTVHAEIKAISHAARDGIGLDGSTIYMNEWFPCDNCAKAIVEAGIIELVTPDKVYEDKKKHTLVERLRKQPYNFEMAEKLIRKAGIKIIIDPLIRPY